MWNDCYFYNCLCCDICCSKQSLTSKTGENWKKLRWQFACHWGNQRKMRDKHRFDYAMLKCVCIKLTLSLMLRFYCFLFLFENLYIIIWLWIWPAAWLTWVIGQARARRWTRADDARRPAVGRVGVVDSCGQARIAMSCQGHGLLGQTDGWAVKLSYHRATWQLVVLNLVNFIIIPLTVLVIIITIMIITFVEQCKWSCRACLY